MDLILLASMTRYRRKILAIYDAVIFSVAPVIDEDASTGYSVLSPMMNSASIWIVLGATNMLPLGAIVECFRRNVCYVPETIPLLNELAP